MSRKKRELRQLTIEGGYVVEASKDLQDTWGGRRKGAGRPKTAPDTATISIRIQASLAALIRAKAAASGQSVSKYLEELISDTI